MYLLQGLDVHTFEAPQCTAFAEPQAPAQWNAHPKVFSPQELCHASHAVSKRRWLRALQPDHTQAAPMHLAWHTMVFSTHTLPDARHPIAKPASHSGVQQCYLQCYGI